MRIGKGILITVLSLTLLSSCSITRTVQPISNAQISELCIQNNSAVLMQGFLPELKSQVESTGIKTRVFDGLPPADCVYHMEYDANWHWDFAMYLSFADLRVFEKNRMIGQAIYDARSGGLNFDKFGPTDQKLKSLTDELFGPLRAVRP